MFRLNSGQHLEEQINSMMLTIKHQLFPVRNHASRASVTALFSWLPQFQGYEPNRGGWEWSNADVMNYINWETNPSSSSGNHCGTLSRASGFLKWRENYCNLELPYVCKFKAQSTELTSWVDIYLATSKIPNVKTDEKGNILPTIEI